MLCLTPYSFKLMIENYIENQNGTGQPANDRDHQLCHKFLIFKSNVLVFKLNFSLAMQFLYFSFLHSQQQDNNQRKAASSKQATGGGTLLKKETLAQVFSCEFCEISKNTFFTEQLWTTVSAAIGSSIQYAQIHGFSIFG